MKLMLFILFIVIIAWIADAIKNAECDVCSRNYCAQRGYKYYLSSTGLRYTSNGQKVYK